MFSQLEAVATPAEQQRQLAALQAVVLGLLGLGIDAGAVVVPGVAGWGWGGVG